MHNCIGIPELSGVKVNLHVYPSIIHRYPDSIRKIVIGYSQILRNNQNGFTHQVSAKTNRAFTPSKTVGDVYG